MARFSSFLVSIFVLACAYQVSAVPLDARGGAAGGAPAVPRPGPSAGAGANPNGTVPDAAAACNEAQGAANAHILSTNQIIQEIGAAAGG
ncbi:hypothetical protein B0H34DRAFT_392778 [Crassisporium funariophilum]|nr:hypothetical protein B0H34DRAFT_392778 [Crassisporium funariophilum]